MKITLPFFGLQIQASLAIIRPRPPVDPFEEAQARALNEAWSELLLTWRMAPEFIAQQKDLGPCLRLALLGSAQAIAEGKENPLSPLDDLDGDWSWFAREVTSPAAMSSDSPFYRARHVVAKNIGGYGSCLERADFNAGARLLLRQIHPRFYAQAAEGLGKRLHEVEIAAAAQPAAGSGKTHRL